MTASTDERLIEGIVEAEMNPTELARAAGLTHEHLAAWVSCGAHLGTIESLARLSDLRAQMLVSKYRATAAARLIEIASAREPNELARKACVDLLKADLAVFPSAATTRRKTAGRGAGSAGCARS